jgi:predicted phosphodiesterase
MKQEKWLIIPDAHFPFVRKQIWTKVLKLVKDEGKKITGVVINGDFLDLFTLGSYNENSLYNLRNLTLENEYDSGNQGLDELDSVLPKGAKKHYIWGNHEDRFHREVQKGDKAKYGNALVSPTEALRLRERGYRVYENWMDDYVTLGKHLDVFHGVYVGANASKKHLEKTGHSCIFGHSHLTTSYRTGDRAAYNIGTLADIWGKGFKYCPRLRRLEWSNGFAVVNISESGLYYVDQVNIYNDQFYYNGKFY